MDGRQAAQELFTDGRRDMEQAFKQVAESSDSSIAASSSSGCMVSTLGAQNAGCSVPAWPGAEGGSISRQDLHLALEQLDPDIAGSLGIIGGRTESVLQLLKLHAPASGANTPPPVSKGRSPFQFLNPFRHRHVDKTFVQTAIEERREWNKSHPEVMSEFELIRIEIKGMKQKVMGLLKAKALLKEELATAQAQRSTATAVQQASDDKVKVLEATVKKLRSAIKQSQDARKHLEGRLDLLACQLTAALASNVTQGIALNDQGEEVQTVRGVLEEVDKKRVVAEERRERLEVAMRSQQIQYGLVVAGRDALNQQYALTTSAKVMAQQEVGVLAARLQEEKAWAGTLERLNHQLAAAVKEGHEKNTQLTSEKKCLEAIVENDRARFTELEEHHTAATTDNLRLQGEVAALQAQLAAWQAWYHGPQ